jgi:hypothetical protein
VKLFFNVFFILKYIKRIKKLFLISAYQNTIFSKNIKKLTLKKTFEKHD